MIFAPAAPKTRGIKAEEDFSQDFVQIDFKKFRNNVGCHLSEEEKTKVYWITIIKIELPVTDLPKTHLSSKLRLCLFGKSVKHLWIQCATLLNQASNRNWQTHRFCANPLNI